MAKNNVSRRTFVTLAGGAAAVPAAAAQGRKAVVSPAAMNMATPQAQGDPIKIVTTHQFAPNEIRQIEQAAAPTKVEIIICRDRGEIDSAPHVQWVMNGGAGVENTPQDLRDHPVPFTNYARTFAPGISETAIGLLLALTHRIHTYMKQFYVDKEMTRLGTPKSDHHVELAGRVMGIVGMGGIGTAIARRAHYGLDMRIVATDAKPIPKPHFVEELHDPTWFEEMVG